MFLTEQFRLLQQRLEDAIPTAKRAFLQQFYSQVCNNLMFSFCTMYYCWIQYSFVRYFE